MLRNFLWYFEWTLGWFTWEKHCLIFHIHIFFFLSFSNFLISSFNISFLTVVFSGTVTNIPTYCLSPSSISESCWVICSNICTCSECKQACKCRRPLWHWQQLSQPWQRNLISCYSLHTTNQSRNNLALAHTNQLKSSPRSCPGISLIMLLPLYLRKSTSLSLLEAAVMIFTLSARCNQDNLHEHLREATLTNILWERCSSDMDHNGVWTSLSFKVLLRMWGRDWKCHLRVTFSQWCPVS